jgi:hypothetical protein
MYIIMLWDHRRICGPSLTETSLCGAYLQKGAKVLSSLITLNTSEPFAYLPFMQHSSQYVPINQVSSPFTP